MQGDHNMINTRRFPRTTEEAWPTEADRTGIHHDESAPRAWPFVWILISITLLLAALVAFGGPSAQQEAEDVADDAATAQMQDAIDRACHGKTDADGLRCALDTLQRLQPDRWISEDAARAALAVRHATNTKE